MSRRECQDKVGAEEGSQHIIIGDWPQSYFGKLYEMCLLQVGRKGYAAP